MSHATTLQPSKPPIPPQPDQLRDSSQHSLQAKVEKFSAAWLKQHEEEMAARCPEKKIVLDLTSRDAKELVGQYATRTEPVDGDLSYVSTALHLEGELILAVTSQSVTFQDHLFLKPTTMKKEAYLHNWQPVTLKGHPMGFFFNQCRELPSNDQKRCEDAIKILARNLPCFNYAGHYSLPNDYPFRTLRQKVSEKLSDKKLEEAHEAIDTLQTVLGTIKVEHKGTPSYEDDYLNAFQEGRMGCGYM
jgi:hypothetical protein